MCSWTVDNVYDIVLDTKVNVWSRVAVAGLAVLNCSLWERITLHSWDDNLCLK